MTSPNVTGGVTMVTQQQQQQNVSGKGQGKQPQLLPKPAQLAAQVQQQQQQQQQQVTRLLAPTTVTCGSQFVLNTGGNVLTTFSGAQGANTSAPLLLGQMMGSAGSNNTPILIQVNNYQKIIIYAFYYDKVKISCQENNLQYLLYEELLFKNFKI
jgi:hypothetical protein